MWNSEEIAERRLSMKQEIIEGDLMIARNELAWKNSSIFSKAFKIIRAFGIPAVLVAMLVLSMFA